MESSGEENGQPDKGGAPDAAAPHATVATLPDRLRKVWLENVGDSERALLVSWGAFAGTFGAARLITHRLRRGGGSGGIIIRGRHVHHYNFGIALLAAVGAIGLGGRSTARRHPATATAYGSGVALIVDEFALLLDLQDVYWGADGRTSVDLAIGTIGVGGLYLAAAPFWHGAIREVANTANPNK